MGVGGTHRCGECGQPGHNRRTCTRLTTPPLVARSAAKGTRCGESPNIPKMGTTLRAVEEKVEQLSTQLKEEKQFNRKVAIQRSVAELSAEHDTMLFTSSEKEQTLEKYTTHETLPGTDNPNSGDHPRTTSEHNDDIAVTVDDMAVLWHLLTKDPPLRYSIIVSPEHKNALLYLEHMFPDGTITHDMWHAFFLSISPKSDTQLKTSRDAQIVSARLASSIVKESITPTFLRYAYHTSRSTAVKNTRTSDTIGLAIAVHPATPHDIIEKCLRHPYEHVRVMTASRSDLTAHMIRGAVSEEKLPTVRAKFARNPATPISVLLRFSKAKNSLVHEALLDNNNVTDVVLAALAHNPHTTGTLKRKIYRHPAASDQTRHLCRYLTGGHAVNS